MRPIIAIPATTLLVYRAWSRNSLTPLGILAAVATAVAHAYHDWSVFFALLATFFLAGTAVTKVKHTHKASLTQSSNGDPTIAPHPRTSIQVLANSLVASILIVLHAAISSAHVQSHCFSKPFYSYSPLFKSSFCRFQPADLLVVGAIANYAAVAADTFSSELGILSRGQPVLMTDLWALFTFRPRRVPPGTNGGVTLLGLLAGVAGAAVIGAVAVVGLPFCKGWTGWEKLLLLGATTVWGALGSVLDSILGGLFQASVMDARTRKIVEGEGGGKVSVAHPQRHRGDNDAETTAPTSASADGTKIVVSGMDLLSNNGVNFAMALSMSLGAMAVVAWWARIGIPDDFVKTFRRLQAAYGREL